MKKLKLYAGALSLAILAGCASFQNDEMRLPVMYTTLKVIERDNGIYQEDVKASMQTLRSIIENDFTLQQGIVSAFNQSVDMSGLDAADRFLVMEVLIAIEDSFEHKEGEVRSVRALELIEYVERAVEFY